MVMSPEENNQRSSSPSGNSIGPSRFFSDADMIKRQNHFLTDRTGTKNDIASFVRFPKFPCTVLRRSWKFKLLILLVVSAISALCLYSGVISTLIPSFSYNLLLGQSDSIRVPRIAINLGPGGIQKANSMQDENNGVQAGGNYFDGVIKHGGTEEPKIDKGEKRFPSSIIFGVSKCGTRAVLEYLKIHPDVVAPMAEVNFFDNETLFKRGTGWYLQQMPFAKSHQLIVEKSPDYFQTPECASLIQKLNADIKLILLLRDPVERLVSQYMQLLDKNPSLNKFEDWVIHPRTGKVNTDVPSVMVSAYSKHLENWLAVFPRDQILIIESNRLRHAPFEEMKRVESFLKLRPYFEQSNFYFNSSRGFFCLRYKSTGKTKCLGKSKGRQHIPVDRDVLKILYSFYQPYNQRLNKLLGVKFPWS